WLEAHSPLEAQIEERVHAQFEGRLRTARAIAEKTSAAYRDAGLREGSATALLDVAAAEISTGLTREGLAHVGGALALSDTRDRSAMAAILLAVAGRVDEAQRRLERAERDYPPTFTFLRAVIIPEIRGAIDLARGKAAAVLVDMPPAPPYDSRVLSAMWV